MVRLIVECDDLIKTLEEWLTALDLQPGDKLEIVFGEGEMTIRPESVRDAEMRARLLANMKKYESALRRLADS